MMRKLNWIALISLVLSVFLVYPLQAQSSTISINGSGSTEWFISGEASLVMNGFDLRNFGVQLPTVIESVSIEVVTPTPGSPVDVVVYQDANGGSPSDSVLIGQGRADIATAGTFTFTFEEPVAVTEPVIWVGFYLPVDFRFSADSSGTSVLTYWAWTPNARFDLSNLSSAEVFGPADGTAPVNINMNGTARITATIQGATTTDTQQTTGTIGQIPGRQTDLSPMHPYEFCSPVLVDVEDLAVHLGQRVDFHCRVAYELFAPPAPPNYLRRGFLYDIFTFGAETAPTKLPDVVTHCIRPAPEDLQTAVLGVAYGAPRMWHLLPSQRYDDLVCAELDHVGFLSYFVPGTESQTTQQ